MFYHLTFRLSERALSTLIGFLRALINFLSVITGHALLVKLAQAFPRTIHDARAAYRETNFVEYIVCPKYDCLYTINDCVLSTGESKRCSFIQYPNYPHLSRRCACNETLMKRIQIGNRYKLVPKKI